MYGLAMYKHSSGYVIGYAVWFEYIATDWFDGVIKEASLESISLN